MSIFKKSSAVLIATLALLAVGLEYAHAEGAANRSSTEQRLNLGVAPKRVDIDRAMVLGAALAGNRIVAVGEEGAIMLSDDGGKTFRQARQVPADSTLTSVSFIDAKHGWAAGHWGVILYTDDGGESWIRQRSDTSIDQPIFSVVFRDALHGWAVGLWSLLLKTDDGGKTWQAQKLGKGEGLAKEGVNFYSVFLGRDRHVFATGEQGTMLRSADEGQTWTTVKTGYNGSLWTGTEAKDGPIYVGGLRGHIFKSNDDGDSWEAVNSGGAGSITALLSTDEGVAGVGLDGLVIFKKTEEAAFANRHLDGRPALTALIVDSHGHEVLFSKNGVVQVTK